MRQATRLDIGARLQAVRAKFEKDLVTRQRIPTPNGPGPEACVRVDLGRVEVSDVFAHDAYLRLYVQATASAAAYPLPALCKSHAALAASPNPWLRSGSGAELPDTLPRHESRLRREICSCHPGVRRVHLAALDGALGRAGRAGDAQPQCGSDGDGGARGLGDAGRPAPARRARWARDRRRAALPAFAVPKDAAQLAALLAQRQADRQFIDERTRACYALNQRLGRDITDPDYRTVLGLRTQPAASWWGRCDPTTAPEEVPRSLPSRRTCAGRTSRCLVRPTPPRWR